MDIERLGRKLGTYTIDWLYFAFVFAFFGFLGWAFGNETIGEENLWTYALVVIAAYYILMLVLRQMRPRIHLYEEGVLVLEHGKQNLYTWDELTHFTGQRHTTYVNGIPIFRTGANQFFAGQLPAFRIGAMTNWADALADYCLSRMAEREIYPLEQAIRSGQRVHLNLIDMTSEGVGSPKNFYKWSEIKNIRLENNAFDGGIVIKAKIDGKLFDETLGSLGGVQAYAFLGVVDALTGSKYLPRMQEIVASPYKRIMNNRVLLIVIGLVFFILVATFISAWATN